MNTETLKTLSIKVLIAVACLQAGWIYRGYVENKNEPIDVMTQGDIQEVCNSWLGGVDFLGDGLPRGE